MELAKEEASLEALNVGNIQALTESGQELLEHHCKACMDKTIDTFFKPCGHTLYCVPCAEDRLGCKLGKIRKQFPCDTCSIDITHVLTSHAYSKSTKNE